MDALYGQIERCNRCGLGGGRVVRDRGKFTARVLFVGEAPGKNEAEKGRPFIGKAGKRFDECLGLASLQRSNIFVANVVRCRPTVGGEGRRNRIPNKSEISACLPWLRQEVKLLQPRLVVTLGNTALQVFLPHTVSEVHGRVLDSPYGRVFPMYHPGYATYRREVLPVLRSDFRVLGQKIRPHAV